MLFGVGTDIVEIERVLQACRKDSFLLRYFTQAEQEMISKRKERAASSFAAKEAVVKAFGTGFHGLCPIEIEILRDDLGAPYVKLYGKAREYANRESIKKIHLSLSDTKEFATAFVVLELGT